MVILTATLLQYANGNFFIQAQGSNLSEVAGSLSTFGMFAAPILPNTQYGITILPAQGTSYSRFGTTFTSNASGTQDITAILEAAIPPPFGSGGTVTNTQGALTKGFVTVGNDGNDIEKSPVDYGITAADTFSVPRLIVNDPSGAGISIAQSSASTDQTAAVSTNTSSFTFYGYGVLGSSAALPGFFFENLATGAYNFVFRSADSSHSVNAMQSLGILGWSSSEDQSSDPVDTAFSRMSQEIIAIGNGTQGDASGGLAVAVLVGPDIAPTGSGVSGQWSLSKDGKLSFCKAGTWEVVASAS